MKILILLSLISFTSLSHVVRSYPDAPLEIITVGHPTLYLVAEQVDNQEFEDKDFQDLIDNMITTMKKAGGVGLAAPQVNISKRLFVMKPNSFKRAEAIVNPILTYVESAGKKMSNEGCLSIPGKSFKVERYKKLHMTYQDRHGEHKTETARGFRAIVIQHEYDHLNGNLINDLFSKSLKLEDDFAFTVPRM
jgi:peptide deformylase